MRECIRTASSFEFELRVMQFQSEVVMEVIVVRDYCSSRVVVELRE